MNRKSLIIESALLACCVSVALALTVISPSSTSAKPTFIPAVLGGQPPGAVVLAREDKDLAVALAVAPRAGQLLLVATVLGQDGTGTAGLNVSFTARTRTGATPATPAVPCTSGCYAATVSAPGRPTAVTVAIDGPGAASAPLTFEIPSAWPPRPALSLVRQAERAYSGVKTLVTHERLASNPTAVLHTTYFAVAPNTLHLKTRGGAEAIMLGKTRWDRQAGQPWRRSPQTPQKSIKPYWTPLVQDATLLGSATIKDRPTWIVSFANPQIPAWFTIWIDKNSYRTLQLRMTASAHFMVHEYGPFDAPLHIAPPPG